jgi:hypothetical protein
MNTIPHAPRRNREHAPQLPAAENADGFSGWDCHHKSQFDREGAKRAKTDAKIELKRRIPSRFPSRSLRLRGRIS